MPIHLPAPAHQVGGPDGQGWNRINLGSFASDECALRPLDYSHYRESQDTRRSHYGGYDSCISGGKCEGCPVFERHETMRAFTDRVLVRIDRNGTPWLMDHPEKGWSSLGLRWTWGRLAVLTGWYPAEKYSDEHGDGFWLDRADDNPAPSI